MDQRVGRRRITLDGTTTLAQHITMNTKSNIKWWIITSAVVAVFTAAVAFYSAAHRPRNVIGFDQARVWQSVDRYLADETKNGRTHNGSVVIEDLRRSGYMDAETYKHIRTQMTNVPSIFNSALPPDYENTNNIMRITMEGKTVTMLSDGSMD